MTLDEQHSGGNVALERGALLTIRLKENPTTGYRWAIDSAGGLDLDSDRSGSAASAPGAGGSHEFQFRATQPGDHEIQLKQWRDWEGEKSIIGRFSLRVTVK